MHLLRLLALMPAVLAAAQITSGIQSVVSDITSVGGDITSGAESVYTVVTSEGLHAHIPTSGY